MMTILYNFFTKCFQTRETEQTMLAQTSFSRKECTDPRNLPFQLQGDVFLSDSGLTQCLASAFSAHFSLALLQVMVGVNWD